MLHDRVGMSQNQNHFFTQIQLIVLQCEPNSRLPGKLQIQEGVPDNTVDLEHCLKNLTELASPRLLLINLPFALSLDCVPITL